MNWERIRIWLASLLVRETSVCLARRDELTQAQGAARELLDYVETSGGLQEPRRIRAYRRVLRLSSDISDILDDLEVAS